MAAGLGFKTFETGDVLTAGDTNGYLMQGVLVFASAAARDAAITSPQEGQFAFLKDTNQTMYYTGSAWTNLDTTGMTNPMTTTGDTIYSSSGSTPARLGIGSTGQVLTVAGGVPTWATSSSSPAWQTWTPTYYNMSVGNGTVVAKYIQIGNLASIIWTLTFGSTTSFTGGTPAVGLPANVPAAWSEVVFISGKIEDAGTAFYVGGSMVVPTDRFRLQYATGSPMSVSNVSPTAPMTWTTGDIMKVAFTYEVA